jgi:hypothetical protein
MPFHKNLQTSFVNGRHNPKHMPFAAESKGLTNIASSACFSTM